MDTSTPALWLRSQPSLVGSPPPFDTAALPAEPDVLFLSWIREAAAAGVAEPHAATLATVDAAGIPDARTLILKDIGRQGWSFAGQRSSAKGAQLGANPFAALSFWWQPVMRAVRVRGSVHEASREESDADLAARSAAAIEGVPAGDWTLWRIAPTRVEFWQGSPDRRHTRVLYRAAGESWVLSRDAGEAA